MRVLVTGGPTRAYLDRVRFLSNFSTGELAFEVCRALQGAGAEVALVSGPCCQPFDKLRLKHWRPVETTEEMHREVLRLCRSFRPDCAVFAAAVLDFRPARVARGKLSSKTRSWTLRLVPTPKILDDVGRRHPRIRRIGFKLEWDAKRGKARDDFARALIEKKGLAGLCLNFLPEIGGGRHLAYLYDGAALAPVTATTKKEIARWIVRQARG